MKTEAKELIQEGLKLFSLYDRRALKRFYLSAEKSEANLSYLDEKYQTHMRSKARGLFFYNNSSCCSHKVVLLRRLRCFFLRQSLWLDPGYI